MYNHHFTQTLATALLLVGSLVVPAGGPRSANVPSGQGSETEKTLTGLVRDSICKVRNYPHGHKGVTPFSCTLQCVHHEGADYVLIVDDSAYVLKGHRDDLDRFAGGRATVTGRLDGNVISVTSVTAAKR